MKSEVIIIICMAVLLLFLAFKVDEEFSENLKGEITAEKYEEINKIKTISSKVEKLIKESMNDSIIDNDEYIKIIDLVQKEKILLEKNKLTSAH